MERRQFENLRASSLWCARCKAAMPVRERLLLVLADREIYDYLCSGCGDSLGRREVSMSQGVTPRGGGTPGGLLLP
jgi:hypothetical protein